jgi:xylulokinase
MSEYFLGLDSSTQSLTAIIIDFDSGKIIHTYNLNFDKELPHYNAQNGIIILVDDDKVVHSYPLMWVEALEILFEKLAHNEIQIEEIKAISGSGQQHGTVYLNYSFGKTIRNFNPNDSLIKQLEGAFSRATSPIWMDSSTFKQCEEIREILGGMKATIEITGSNTFERFSGPQIRKFFQENPDAYEKTSIIHLVSSFMASILLGNNAPIDHGDGAGMNLMNIVTRQWDERALEATAPDLINKLPPLANSYDVIGTISPYFVQKYGFSAETKLIAWSGDNPNSLIGVGLINRGKAALSLGTSDTYFGYIKNLSLDMNGEGHVFGAPTGDYMSLICYKNGSLAREEIKDRFNLDWNQFSDVLKKTPPGNHGKIILPYFQPEIVPLVLKSGVIRFGFDEKDIESNVRAIVESQFLSMRLHSEWIGEKSEEIYATGGSSINQEILQVAADVFNTPVRQFETSNSAALGAALRAAKSYYDSINNERSWQEIVEKFLNIQKSVIIEPNSEYKDLYEDMTALYKKCENHFLRNGESPETLQKQFIQKYFPL